MTGKLAERLRPAESAPASKLGERADRFVPPALREVPERVASTGRIPFVLLVVSLLAAGLVALLLLNVALAEDSYRLHQLQKETSLLTEERRALEQQVATESAPDALAEKAEAQGMVPSGERAYLDVTKRKGYGKPTAARSAD
ncbi:MAG: cell division protein FtsL [Streptosporangiales bacterium]|nr:cell division protein FtsL [Streptosporangiales bacterium]